jgi:hypothetical protein
MWIRRRALDIENRRVGRVTDADTPILIRSTPGPRRAPASTASLSAVPLAQSGSTKTAR